MRAAPAVAAVAALLVPLAGCARADEPPVITDGPPPLAAEVVLEKSGGIAGVTDTVRVEPHGQWTRTDRAGASREGRLSDTELARLRQLTADPRLAAEAAVTVPPPMCADAFTYRLTIGPNQVGYVDCPPKATPPAVTAQVVDLLNGATG
ncbi:hypothetical protein [Micromonospora sp. NPDC048169]|uniref:hypothetical protein n=1 Tax=Micromonospora sp. NPDC048169 TaxID=3154711 RepID=UPI00340CB8E3